MAVIDTEAALVAQPFVKWAGGKRSLLGRLLAHAPKSIDVYHEPFVGGGALFFALQAAGRMRRARLNDVNLRLVRTYRAIERDVDGVVRRLRRMPNDEAFFLEQRERDIDKASDVEAAVWMLYLNKTCFNGLYRVNRAGKFNTPFGRYPAPTICPEANLRACSRALRGATLLCQDFRTAALAAKAGDFVYFDPPYMTRVGNEFTSYDGAGFGRKDHERLRDTAAALKDKGVRVLVSNSDTDEVRELYAGFDFEEVRGRRSVGADVFRRGHAPDLLIW